MTTSEANKPLGLILQAADLISISQIEIALRDQVMCQNLRIGEILSLRGWLKQETADFFAEEWPKISQKSNHQPLGYYLKSAALLDEGQIKEILQEQARLKLKFGSLAVLRGWIKRQTIKFFLENLISQSQAENGGIKNNLIQLPKQSVTTSKFLQFGDSQITIPSNFQQIWTDEDLNWINNLNYVIAWQD
jgi:hypothetical protein